MNPVFSPVSLQRIGPTSLRDPAARASFRELLMKVNVASCGDPHQVTEMWKRGFGSAALQTERFLSAVFRRCSKLGRFDELVRT